MCAYAPLSAKIGDAWGDPWPTGQGPEQAPSSFLSQVVRPGTPSSP